jgi:hypothetical protein
MCRDFEVNIKTTKGGRTMTKEQWIKHMQGATGLAHPDKIGSMRSERIEWHEAMHKHATDCPNCFECAARLRTIKANLAAKTTRHIYADLGMKRVRGALGGIYYE